MAGSTLPLFPQAPPATPKDRMVAGRPSRRPRGPAPKPGVLWLALWFPVLELEALREIPGEEAQPVLVVTGEGGAAEVVAVNRAAHARGVCAGMRLSAALARVDAPVLWPRDPAVECRALEEIASVAEGFSSRVSLVAPRCVLLEVAGSLSLFGGLRALRERLREALTGRGYDPSSGVAPTPVAAEWLARHGREQVVTRRESLSASLGQLPVSCLEVDERLARDLAGIGVRRLADLLRLPRDGLARRFGPRLLQRLDRALGRCPDPRPLWQGSLRFREPLELPAETGDRERLLWALEGLLDSLVRFLRRHDSMISELCLECRHRAGEPTPVRLGLSTEARDVAHLAYLFRVRLERVELAAPVIGLELRSGPLRAWRGRSAGLFADLEKASARRELLERLRSRLGPEELFPLAVSADHRPERAWTRGVGSTPPTVFPERPAWLLEQPRLLGNNGNMPEGIRLQAGPERIETGWWEGADIARDYYRARGKGGDELWVFRDRRSGDWYLHGLFG